MHIHLDWSGPYPYDEALQQRDAARDYGVYQIYGTHPVYGRSVLLYIGKADRQTFGLRLSQEAWRQGADGQDLKVYLGRLAGYGPTPDADTWSGQIGVAERMLIYAHWPAGNSSGLNVALDARYHDVCVLNWGQHASLLPEVSGLRYSDRYGSGAGYGVYGAESGEVA